MEDMELPRFTLPLVRTRHELLDQGRDDAQIRAALKAGTLVRVRRGCYVDARPEGSMARGSSAAAPVRAVPAVPAVSAAAATAAVAAQLGPVVFSHATAAALWQLPFLGAPPEAIHLTLPREAGGIVRAGVHRHTGALAPEEVVEHRGIRLTSLARTLVDVARTDGFRDGLVMADHALHGSRDPEALRQAMSASIRRLRGAVGIGNARRMADFAVVAAESPGESLSRIVFREQKVPEPLLQFRLSVPLPGGARGDFITDFAWKHLKAVGEFDGRVKYGRYLREGQTPGDAVFEEKGREDAIRSVGWLVLRWTWEQLQSPEVLGRRVRETLAARARELGVRPSELTPGS
ncbi:Transcriptional regulator, AbiEi antitoxin, Type IV TA system [Raineyella antarctica]|uniref:Transcriptional regulator, AbiEi antitoxin, Type IV TA system n=1 Tax=Raineyella antarctica TaxID=1577474 RepID=A0A1G6GF66_9ACTN|nr:hypothetical protein [Raineyella antarctica]SDB80651.1 Transcriptional regulator, AbiEi antitoxin, Type IV TA system [Raineyella antarctica]